MSTRPLNRDRLRIRTNESGERVIDLRDADSGTRRKGPGRTHPKSSRPVELGEDGQLRHSKLFGSPAFRRLWFSQVLSSTGDWIGLVAITAIASRVGGAFAMGAVALVIAARLIPGLFLSPFVGVLIDRWNRKRIMVATDIGRGVVLCLLPFVHELWALFVASLLLELMTLMWGPAKEASVPNMVRKEFLPTANSLSLIASYGTFVPAMAVFAVLSKVPDWLGQTDTFGSLGLTKESIALYFDALTYLLSAAVIATLSIPHIKRKKPKEVKGGPWSTLQEAKEGWAVIGTNMRVRTVVIGMAMGLIGGGVIVPLGPAFANDVLGAGSSGYGLLMTAMGVGTALGVLAISVIQKRILIDQTFVAAVIGAGVALGVASIMNGLAAAAICISALGLCAGAIYVLGFTILQVSVDDAMRGRVFAAFYTVTRLSLLLALLVAPLLSLALNGLSNSWFDGDIDIFGVEMAIPGVRLTLLIGATIIVIAGLLAARPMRRSSVETNSGLSG